MRVSAAVVLDTEFLDLSPAFAAARELTYPDHQRARDVLTSDSV
jgi:hypothetical protein